MLIRDALQSQSQNLMGNKEFVKIPGLDRIGP